MINIDNEIKKGLHELGCPIMSDNKFGFITNIQHSKKHHKYVVYMYYQTYK